MWHRRGTVHGNREPDQVIEVGLDELLGFDDQRLDDDDLDTDQGLLEDDIDTSVAILEDDVDLNTDERFLQDDAQPRIGDESREEQPDLAGAGFSAAFFGWLVAGSTVVLLLALVGVACSLIGWNRFADWSKTDAGTGRLLAAAWIVLVLSMGLGAFSGGYASARMVRSHRHLQALGVWLFGWTATTLIAALAYLTVRKYDFTTPTDWPPFPLTDLDRTPAALLALTALLLVTLLGTLLVRQPEFVMFMLGWLLGAGSGWFGRGVGVGVSRSTSAAGVAGLGWAR